MGELLQGALRLDGRAEPFLITLPSADSISTARVRPARHWNVRPADRDKALRAAIIAAEHWGTGPLSLVIDSAIPVARGFGSSTADCAAAIRAVADLAGASPSPEQIARIAWRAESACDSTMFGSEPVVFLPRRGECLFRLGGSLPAFKVTAVDLGGPDVDTLACPAPRYSESDLDRFEELLSDLRSGPDAIKLARAATESARIHQRYRPHPRWSRLLQTAESRGALGVAISHSGTAAAILERPAA